MFGTLNAHLNARKHHKIIKSTHNYEIQSNNKYADAFQYTSVEMRDNAEERIQSDFVMKNLKFAYVEESQTRKMDSV